MEKTSKHKLLNSVLFTALAIPVIFFILRDLIAALLGLLIEMTAGRDSFLYAINDDIARLVIAGLLMLVMPLFFRGKYNFGLKDGNWKLGLCLALPELIVPLWNLLQIAVYKAPLVSGASAVIAAIIHGIGPGVSEEIFCRGFVVSNLMRIRKDKPHRVLYCVLASGISFGLLHMPNVLATKDIGATIIQVLYTAIIGIFSGAVYVRSRSLWGVMLMHTLTDITAFIAVFDSNATGMDIAFLAFGSVLFLALALYLIRPSKQTEICTLWEESWSFGEETEKNRAGAKTAGIVSAVIAGLLVIGVGVTVYQAKMGYDLPLAPLGDRELDADITYEIGTDGQTLTISLPCGAGETYSVDNPASDRLLLQERGQEGDKYRFLFRLKGNVTEKIRLKFSLHIGKMTTSMRDYSVTVKFDEKGNISDVKG